MLSQAQSCSISENASGVPKITPFPGGWKVVATFNPTLTRPDCLFNPTQVSSAAGSEPENFSKNGVSVNIRDTKI
jgi:hypothetical protein